MSNIGQTNDALIEKLCGELTPVKPLCHPMMSMLPLAVISLAYVLGMAWMIGMRGDFMPKLFEDMTYSFELLLALMISISAAIALGYLSFPDMRGKEWVKIVPVVLSAVFLVWGAFRFIYAEENVWVAHIVMYCFMNGIIFLGLPLVLLTFFSNRRGATTRPNWSTAMTTLSFSGLGWIGLRLTCGMDSFAHAFLFHFLPFAFAGIIMGLFARRIFRW